MNTKKKVLIASTLLIAIGGFYIYKNMKKKPLDEVIPEIAYLDTQKVLALGSTGEEVKRLQSGLKGGLVEDGIFGSLTEKRLKDVTGKTSITLREYNNILTSKK